MGSPDVTLWPLPTPLPVGAVNAYRLDGPRAALVDAGPRLPDTEAALRQRLREHPVRVLLITHEHADHAGQARLMQEEFGVEVWTHEAEAPTLQAWDEEAGARERDYEAGLRAAGVPADLREEMRYGGRRYDAWSRSVRPDRTFTEGETLEVGTRRLRVVHAPGHTPGSHLLTDGAITFSGDTLLERITPNALSVRRSERAAFHQYLRTLERLRPMALGQVLPGHGNAFADVGRVIARALDHAQRRRARIVETLRARPNSAYGTVQALFQNLPRNQLFLALSEVLGHLEALRMDGALSVETREGVEWYHAAAR